MLVVTLTEMQHRRQRCRDWSGRPGSNRRHSAWEADVLPLNYSRPVFGWAELKHSAYWMCVGGVERDRTAGAARLVWIFGGAERDRTADLLVANEALSQLSYSPTRRRGRGVSGCCPAAGGVPRRRDLHSVAGQGCTFQRALGEAQEVEEGAELCLGAADLCLLLMKFLSKRRRAEVLLERL